MEYQAIRHAVVGGIASTPFEMQTAGGGA